MAAILFRPWCINLHKQRDQVWYWSADNDQMILTFQLLSVTLLISVGHVLRENNGQISIQFPSEEFIILKNILLAIILISVLAKWYLRLWLVAQLLGAKPLSKFSDTSLCKCWSNRHQISISRPCSSSSRLSDSWMRQWIGSPQGLDNCLSHVRHQAIIWTNVNRIWWLCLVPTSTTRFASDLGYRMTKNLIGL